MKFIQLEIAESYDRSPIYPGFLPLPVPVGLSYVRRWRLAVLAPLRVVASIVGEQADAANDHFLRKGYLP